MIESGCKCNAQRYPETCPEFQFRGYRRIGIENCRKMIPRLLFSFVYRYRLSSCRIGWDKLPSLSISNSYKVREAICKYIRTCVNKVGGIIEILSYRCHALLFALFFTSKKGTIPRNILHEIWIRKGYFLYLTLLIKIMLSLLKRTFVATK